MTYHSYSNWKFEDEPTDEVIDDVIRGLGYNKEWNNNKRYTPDAYGLFTHTDHIIYNIGIFLDGNKDKKFTKKIVKKSLKKSRAPKSVEIITLKVLKKMKLLSK